MAGEGVGEMNVAVVVGVVVVVCAVVVVGGCIFIFIFL